MKGSSRASDILTGYPTLANFIASDKDAAIYRKFEKLSARCLLYQQSELHDLEQQLEQLDLADSRDIDDDEAQQAAVSWDHYASSATEKGQKRRELIMRIKAKLKAYRTFFEEWNMFGKLKPLR